MSAAATFLCRACAAGLCTDCRSTVEEYQELATRRGAALHAGEEAVRQAQEEAVRQERRADDLDAVLRAGLPPLLLAWMDSLSPAELRKAVEARAVAAP